MKKKILSICLCLMTVMSNPVLPTEVVWAAEVSEEQTQVDQELDDEAEVLEEQTQVDQELDDETEIQMQEAAFFSTGEKWYAKLEAENGDISGNYKAETFPNIDGGITVVGWFDKGETGSVTLKINVDFTDDVQMIVRYRSGEDRSLCYKVNDGEVKVIENLNSGDWNHTANAPEQTINLQAGDNMIKLYGPENKFAAPIDYITLSRNGGTADDIVNQEELTIKFMDNDTEVKSLIKKNKEIIEEGEVPEATGQEGKDFLGWYWGLGSKYEAVFPMDLSKIPEKVRTNLGDNLVFVAKYGKNIPANPVEKAGYRLIFQDEFHDTALDRSKWVDKYLSSWTTTPERTQTWTETNGIMNLQITETMDPWCPKYDGETVVSGFTTGQRNGLHNWNGTNEVQNPADTELTHINQYGYYELRAKTQGGSSRHSAWWLLGFEDIPEESAEIDIFEVLGLDSHSVPSALHNWKDEDAFGGRVGSYTNGEKDFHNEYHIYAFDWQQGTGSGAYPDKIVFYVDGEQYASANVNIDYPMIQLFSLYEKRNGGWTGDWEWMPYPNSFELDYVRVYKKLQEGQSALPADQLKVEKVIAEDVVLTPDEVELKAYEGLDYTEKNLPGTKSYVRVEWNDGVETQEPVFWEPITEYDLEKLKTGETITKKGNVKSIGKTTEMKISVEEPPYVPYTMEGMTLVNEKALDYVFDGLINENELVPSGEFTVKSFENDRAFFTYDFQKNVKLSGVDIWTNYGSDQGITEFKVAVWDKEKQQWNTIKGDDGGDKVFKPVWTTQEAAAERWSAEFDEVETNKVKVIVCDANRQWNNKFSIREIGFQKKDIPLEAKLEGIEITGQPTKTEYEIGEKLDTTGLKVKAKYSDGTTKEVTGDVTVGELDSRTAGEKTIAVSYEGKTAVFTVKVVIKGEEGHPVNDKDKDSGNSDGEKKTNTRSTTEQMSAVKTGDEAPVGVLAGLLALSGAGIVVLLKRKKNA